MTRAAARATRSPWRCAALCCSSSLMLQLLVVYLLALHVEVQCRVLQQAQAALQQGASVSRALQSQNPPRVNTITPTEYLHLSVHDPKYKEWVKHNILPVKFATDVGFYQQDWSRIRTENDSIDVVIATQAGANRVGSLVNMAEQWAGPVSAAIFVPYPKTMPHSLACRDRIVQFIKASNVTGPIQVSFLYANEADANVTCDMPPPASPGDSPSPAPGSNRAPPKSSSASQGTVSAAAATQAQSARTPGSPNAAESDKSTAQASWTSRAQATSASSGATTQRTASGNVQTDRRRTLQRLNRSSSLATGWRRRLMQTFFHGSTPQLPQVHSEQVRQEQANIMERARLQQARLKQARQRQARIEHWRAQQATFNASDYAVTLCMGVPRKPEFPESWRDEYDKLYPVNALRNLALGQVPDGAFVFALDVDFLPSRRLYHDLTRGIWAAHLGGMRTRYARNGTLETIVVPAFERLAEYDADTDTLSPVALTYKDLNDSGSLVRPVHRPADCYGDCQKIDDIYYPRTFEALRSTLKQPSGSANSRAVDVFHRRTWPAGHSCYSWLTWLQNPEPQELMPMEYSHPCEPYVIAFKASMPRYDERFRGRFQDKVEQLLHMELLGFEWSVLPEHFVMHMPHKVVSMAKNGGNWDMMTMPYALMQVMVDEVKQTPAFRHHVGVRLPDNPTFC